MLTIVQSAIEGRQVLDFDYYPGNRTIEPHALGYGSDGQLLLRAYQTGGASASGEHAHWKLFRLDRADRVMPTEDFFSGPRPGYVRGDKAMKGGILAQL